MVHNLCRVWLCCFSMQFLEAPYPLFTHCVQPLPQALRFTHRRGEHKTQETGDEPQGTMGRVQTVGEALPRPLSPSRLTLHGHFMERERRLDEAALRL